MRVYRNIAGTVTAACVAMGAFFHFLSIGAFIGMLVCAYLWRNELWVWAHETWRRLLEAIFE